MYLSPNDNNKYRHVTLENGLRILLIQDLSAQKAAAALAINVGSFDDPKNREGLAHYFERMLFLGTQKYPKIDDFQNFISLHGGKHNSWTGIEHTCFFFDISPQQIEPALDRFSRFFIDPLFNPEALDKERLSIDSEYRLKFKDELRRLHQVHKAIINPEHPFARFSTGNMNTLEDRDGKTIRDELIEFYEQKYSANLMTLTILAPQELDELEVLVVNQFSLITNQNLPRKVIQTEFVREEDKGIFVRVEPVKELKKLLTSFYLPNIDQYYHSKPLSYFARLLGFEGEGSLMQYLKNKNWITSLTSGGGIEGSNFKEFIINVSLTKLGIQHTDEIIQTIFEFIELIKKEGLTEWRFKEKQAVLESAFQFQDKIQPLDMVRSLAMNLHRYSEDDVIYGDYKMSGYDESLLRAQLEYLTPQNSRVILLAKEQNFDRKTQWYFTPYSVEKYSKEQLNLWVEPNLNPELTLPNPNPYICYDLTVQELKSHHKKPTIITKLPGFTLWHLQETEFRVPKGVIYIAVDSPHAVSTARKIVKMRLVIEMLLDSLSLHAHSTEVAGMTYNLYTHQGGVTLMLSGLRQKQPELLNIIFQQFKKLRLDPKRFKEVKAQVQQKWQSIQQEHPISQLLNEMTGILQPNNPSYFTRAEALETIEVGDLSIFINAVLAELHVEMFVYGDWTNSQALALANQFKDVKKVDNQSYAESLRPLVMLGENEGTFHYEVVCNQDDSAIIVYHQSQTDTPKDIALYTLANYLMSTVFFNKIHTNQQVGYMVGTGNMPLNRHPGLILYSQSPRYTPKELLAIIDDFLNNFHMILLELNDHQWCDSKKGMLNQISAPDNNLKSRAQRLWISIGNKDFTFDEKDKVIDEIEKLSKIDMIHFIENILESETSTRLIMHTKGNNHQQANSLSIGREINCIHTFQQKSKDTALG